MNNHPKPLKPSLYLITGGAGFIGSHTIDALLQEGKQVRVLDNFTTGKQDNLPEHPFLEIIRGDIRDVSAVEKAMSDVTHVLHLAAQISVAASVENPQNSSIQNISGFLNVLDSARRAGVQRFVYASSAAVYGIPHALPLCETSPTAPLSPYGLEKLINDQYASLFKELYGTSTLGLRYFNVYGPRQDPASSYSGVISIFLSRLEQDKALTIHGDGSQTRDFIYVKDVAKANLAALESNLNGVCNLATGNSVSLLTLAETLGTVLHKTPRIEFTPERTGDIRESSSINTRLKDSLGITHFTSLHDGLSETSREAATPLEKQPLSDK
ncbi:MAG: NAD-dependent epimerase/dehydratase family protein [Azovibrio sp.]